MGEWGSKISELKPPDKKSKRKHCVFPCFFVFLAAIIEISGTTFIFRSFLFVLPVV